MGPKEFFQNLGCCLIIQIQWESLSLLGEHIVATLKVPLPKLKTPIEGTSSWNQHFVVSMMGMLFTPPAHHMAAPRHHPWHMQRHMVSPQARLPLVPFPHPEATYPYDWSHPNRKMVGKLSSALTEAINDFPRRQTCWSSSLARIVIDDRLALD